MLVYQHQPLLLNNAYEYQRIKFACPLIFQPSEIDSGTYDIILRDGQNLPYNNLFPRSYVNEPGIRVVQPFAMNMSFLENQDYGEAVELDVALGAG